MLKIPWQNYQEEEIQGIIYQYFLSLNYKVDWFHLEDKHKERDMGCDLLCKKNGESIAIAVKKHPRASDTAQFRRLARKNYTKKIYLYVKTPTPEFRQSIRKYRNKVTIWQTVDLEKALRTTEVGLRILCCIYYSNSTFASMCFDFLSKLHNFTRSISQQDFSNHQKSLSISSKPMSHLWQLKDRAVTIRKSIELLLSILECSEFYNGVTPQALFVIFIETLRNLTFSMKSFIEIWGRMLVKNNSILIQTIRKYGNRSNWGDLWSFEQRLKCDLMYAPGILKKHLTNLRKIDEQDYEEYEQKWSRIYKERGKTYEPTPFLADFIREDFLRGHFNLGLALENTVDQMFEL